MAGVTSIAFIEVKESLDELTQQLCQLKCGSRTPAPLPCQVKTASAKERLQVLYWLKQDNAPSISAIAKAVGKHRNTVQTWLSNYREGGFEVMLKSKKSPGRVRVIPRWAETALAKRLQEPSHGFSSYGKVQQWLAETLGIEAE